MPGISYHRHVNATVHPNLGGRRSGTDVNTFQAMGERVAPTNKLLVAVQVGFFAESRTV